MIKPLLCCELPQQPNQNQGIPTTMHPNVFMYALMTLSLVLFLKVVTSPRTHNNVPEPAKKGETNTPVGDFVSQSDDNRLVKTTQHRIRLEEGNRLHDLNVGDALYVLSKDNHERDQLCVGLRRDRECVRMGSSTTPPYPIK